MEFEYVYGRRVVLEALRGSRKVYEVFGTTTALRWLRDEARRLGVPLDLTLRSVNKQELYVILRRSDHQGLGARVEPFRYTPLRLILDWRPKLVVLVDGVTDPRNLGAIIRSAHLCGSGAVIIPARRSASVTPVVVHASAGATEHTAIAKVDSLPHTITLLRERGYAVVAAESPSPGAKPLPEFRPPEKIAVVLGSEGEGISHAVRRRCTQSVFIPQAGVVDSFNVSVAAGIILYDLALKLGILRTPDAAPHT